MVIAKHCNIFHGDHYYCLFDETQDEDECLCSCDGCEAVRKNARQLHQQELKGIEDYEIRWKKGSE